MGGGDLIASFLDEQAMDEFVISVAPVFIGDGIPLIARRHRHVPLDLTPSNASKMAWFNCTTAFRTEPTPGHPRPARCN